MVSSKFLSLSAGHLLARKICHQKATGSSNTRQEDAKWSLHILVCSTLSEEIAHSTIRAPLANFGLCDYTLFEIWITEISFEIGLKHLKSNQIGIFHPCKLGLRDFRN